MPESIENSKPEKSSNRRIIVLAAFAGILAGALAVYVMERPSGNLLAAGEDNQCVAKADISQALDKAAVGEVAAMRGSDNPKHVAALSFKGPDGKDMTLADKKGKTLLVNLWATWCAPCREEMPALDKLQAEMGSDDFEVVAINVDTGDDTKPKAFLEETGIQSLTHYRDPTMGVFNDLKRKGLALGLPVTMIVDGDGCQIAAMNGPANWAGDDAKALITAAKAANQ